MQRNWKRVAVTTSATFAICLMLTTPASAQRVDFSPDRRITQDHSTVTVEIKIGTDPAIICRSSLSTSNPATGELTLVSDGGGPVTLQPGQDWTVTSVFSEIPDGQYVLGTGCLFESTGRQNTVWSPTLIVVDTSPEPQPELPLPSSGSADTGSSGLSAIIARLLGGS
jgi:hypothetical protein